jgi:carbon-monoxide dehydrogenase iron sulfur subunit
VKKAVFCDPDKCTGCQICELVCSVEKEKKINPYLSRIHMVRIDPLIATALTCQDCDDASCVKSCPRGAIFLGEGGTARIDEQKCTLCGWCIQACPFGAITIHSSHAKVCDLCDGEPKCVDNCPKGALSFLTSGELAQSKRKRLTNNLLG